MRLTQNRLQDFSLQLIEQKKAQPVSYEDYGLSFSVKAPYVKGRVEKDKNEPCE